MRVNSASLFSFSVRTFFFPPSFPAPNRSDSTGLRATADATVERASSAADFPLVVVVVVVFRALSSRPPLPPPPLATSLLLASKTATSVAGRADDDGAGDDDDDGVVLGGGGGLASSSLSPPLRHRLRFLSFFWIFFFFGIGANDGGGGGWGRIFNTRTEEQNDARRGVGGTTCTIETETKKTTYSWFRHSPWRSALPPSSPPTFCVSPRTPPPSAAARVGSCPLPRTARTPPGGRGFPSP